MVGVETPWLVKSADMLLLAYLDGRVVRYRVKDGELLFKSTVTAPWIRLSPEQILQHFTFKTAVADWLQTRTVWRVKDLGRNVPVPRVA